jgi:eukaryotic-like serine/threonine-protein kinase
MQFNRYFVKLIALHVSLVVAVGICIIFLFCQYLLPILTHHGQFVTVPSLKGISLEEVDACLTQRNLHFEVTEEFAYDPEYLPMTVLQQYPTAGTYVKEGRKIYLTLNTQTPPQVKMLNLIDGSVRNAHVCLKSQGLLLGTITYVPDIAQNAVLEQWHQGETIAAGTLITKGAKIDLVVGAGLGKKMVEVPQVVGATLEDAKLLLLGAGIKPGNIAYECTADQMPGAILRQIPESGKKIRVGGSVDLWLVAIRGEALGTPGTSILSEN